MLVKLKTETKTLEQIQEILAVNPEASSLIKQTFIDAIDTLYKELFNPKTTKETTFLIVDDADLDIEIKPEHQQFLKDLVGHSGPYRATKRYKSWLAGLSEGLYRIEGTDKLIPVSWCAEKKSEKSSFSWITLVLLLATLAQSGALLLLLL
jgi:hypothetical protein